MQELINRTKDHLYEVLSQSDYESHEIDYRYEHSLRVANIGLNLADKEKACKKTVVLGCLLHDLGKFESEKGIDHGRVSAEMARPYLMEQNLSRKEIDDICYAIACHVDGKAGYDYEETLEAKIVTDADNIDRFSSSKILQSRLWQLEEEKKSIGEKIESLEKRLQVLNKYRDKPVLETQSANVLFREKVVLQIHFYETLLKDYKLTRTPIW